MKQHVSYASQAEVDDATSAAHQLACCSFTCPPGTFMHSHYSCSYPMIPQPWAGAMDMGYRWVLEVFEVLCSHLQDCPRDGASLLAVCHKYQGQNPCLAPAKPGALGTWLSLRLDGVVF